MFVMTGISILSAFASASPTEISLPIPHSPAENDGRILIRGEVFDQDGEPLTGASVILPGSKTGVSTNLDGAFSLMVPAGASTLRISYIGMKTQEVKLV